MPYVFPHIPDDMQKKAKKKSDKRDASQDSKKRKKHHSSSKREKKVARVEDTLVPHTALPELFSSNTTEVLTTFKGAVSYSKYVNDNHLSWRLNILFTK